MRVIGKDTMMRELTGGKPLVRIDLSEVAEHGYFRTFLRVDAGKNTLDSSVTFFEKVVVGFYSDDPVPILSARHVGLSTSMTYLEMSDEVGFAQAPAVKPGEELLVVLDDPKRNKMTMIAMTVKKGTYQGSYLFEDWSLANRDKYREQIKELIK